MRQSNQTRLARAERDLRYAEESLAHETHWATLAHSRGTLLRAAERAAWNRAYNRVIQLRARVAVRREAAEREDSRVNV